MAASVPCRPDARLFTGVNRTSESGAPEQPRQPDAEAASKAEFTCESAERHVESCHSKTCRTGACVSLRGPAVRLGVSALGFFARVFQGFGEAVWDRLFEDLEADAAEHPVEKFQPRDLSHAIGMCHELRGDDGSLPAREPPVDIVLDPVVRERHRRSFWLLADKDPRS